MLGDDLNETCLAFKRIFKDPLPEEINSHMMHNAAIQQCPWFVLDDKAASAIEEMSFTKPATLLAGLNIARLPHSTFFVESLYAPIDAKRREHYTITHANTSTPKRLGFYVQEVDDGMLETLGIYEIPIGAQRPYTIQLLWSLDTRDDSAFAAKSGLKVMVELSKFCYLSDPSKLSKAAPLYIQDITWTNQYPDQAEAATEVTMSFGIIPSFGLSDAEFARMLRLIDSYRRTGQDDLFNDPNHVEIRALLNDIAQEWRFLISFLMFINSKNVVEPEFIDQAKLNKARAKKGKPSLHNYSYIHLTMKGKRHKNAFNAPASSMLVDDERKVRRHYKVRKTGIFLWNEYTRTQSVRVENVGKEKVRKVVL